MENHVPSKLCAVCYEFLDRPHDPVGPASAVTYTEEKLIQSVAIGCALCFWVSDWVSTFRKPRNITATVRYGEYDYEENMTWNDRPHVMRLHYRSGDHSFFILLRLAFTEKEQDFVRLRPNYDLFSRSSTMVYAKDLSPTTRDATCFLRTRDWLRTCFHDHRLCHKRLANGTMRSLPSRLIDITNLDSPRVVGTKNLNSSNVQYATLSHRWKKQSMPRLLQTNYKNWRKQIDLEGFPAVFEHALEIASRWLGLRYIWIDALCIVQDDLDDWQREAALMGRVYENAYCNLGAYAAADSVSNNGLFLDRTPRRTSLATITVRRKNLDQTFYGYPQDQLEGLSASSLMSRGWVFQERLLSPRSIYFGERLQWECSELQACELYPRGSPVINMMTPWGETGFPFRVTNLLYDEQQHCQGQLIGLWKGSRAKTITNIRIWEFHRKWLFIVEYFSRCELTYPGDCFPALSGLAYYFQHVFHDEYVAGIWKKNLIPGLLWHHRPLHKRGPLKDYRAPTWSWASVSPSVIYPLVHDMPFGRTDDAWAASLEDFYLCPATSNPLSSVVGGLIRLSGCLRPCGQSLNELMARERPLLKADSLDPYQYSLDKRTGLDYADNDCQLHLFLLNYRLTLHKNGAREIIDLRGLILEKVNEDFGHYRRRGAFHHLWLQDRDERTRRYPPFIDFDPRSFERTVITIL